MQAYLNSPKRRWLAAGSLAVVLAAGAATGVVMTGQSATAQQDAVPSMIPGSFADLVEAAKPAVVSVSVEGEQQVRQFGNRGPNFRFDFPDLPEDHPFRDFFEQFGDQFGMPRGEGGGSEDGPRTRPFQATGSGFVISDDGYVVTNNHVIADAQTVTVTFEDGDERTAEVVGTDERTDLALLKIQDASGLAYVEFAEEDVRVGDWVVAVGNPFGLGGTVTAGIVSARGRDISANAYGDFIQIDAAVNRGNSGGPAFNLEGDVVGVNTAIFSPNGGNVGIAFAIPAPTVEQVIDDLRDDGQVTRGFLGVSIQDVSSDIADSLGLDSASGALVTQPTEDGPAGMAGIESGDVITAVDGDQIDDALDLSRTIASKDPGATVEVTVFRDGSEQTISVELTTLEEDELPSATPQPEEEQEPEAPEPTSVGLTLVPNSSGEGVLIQDVESGSAAAGKGLGVGDVILEANNTAIASASDFEDAVEAVREAGRNTILVKASRDGNIRFVGVPLSSPAS